VVKYKYHLRDDPPASAVLKALRAGEMVSMMFYTYVLESGLDHDLYIGWTDDLINRVKHHNDGQVSSTKGRIPLRLVYYEACLSREKAIEREKQLKTGYGRKYLTRRIK
jgi:putative endonuclease